MPHRCLKCGKLYEEGAEELLKGCSECGYKLFLYTDKEEKTEKFERKEIREKERENITQSIEKFLGNLRDEVEVKLRPRVKFDLESIKVIEDGIYEINLTKLLNEVPLIVELKEGSYFVHLASLFTKGKEKTIEIENLEG